MPVGDSINTQTHTHTQFETNKSTVLQGRLKLMERFLASAYVLPLDLVTGWESGTKLFSVNTQGKMSTQVTAIAVICLVRGVKQ